MSHGTSFIRCRDPACDLLPDLAVFLAPESSSLEERRICNQQPRTKTTAIQPKNNTILWIIILVLVLLLVGIGIAWWVWGKTSTTGSVLNQSIQSNPSTQSAIMQPQVSQHSLPLPLPLPSSDSRTDSRTITIQESPQEMSSKQQQQQQQEESFNRSNKAHVIPDSNEWITEIIDSRLENQPAARLSTQDDLQSLVSINGQNIDLILKRITDLERKVYHLENARLFSLPTKAPGH